MGSAVSCNCLRPTTHNRNTYVNEDDNWDERHPEHRVFVLGVAIHYGKLGEDHSLSCVTDGENFMSLCSQSGVPEENRVFLKNKHANRKDVTAAIQNFGRQMTDNDTLVFYFSGHGGDDPKNADRTAMILTKGDGSGGLDWWWDNLIAETFSSALPPNGNVVFVCDCCHSGSITNFEDGCWGNIRGIAISGCQDNEESTDLGTGSLMTDCLFLALQHLQTQYAGDGYSAGNVFNKMLDEGAVLDSDGCDQHFVCTTSRALGDGSYMEWPLQPKGMYAPPKRRINHALRHLQSGNLAGAGTALMASGVDVTNQLGAMVAAPVRMLK